MLLLLMLVFAFSIISLFLLLSKPTKENHFPPGPRGLPLIGNLHQFDSLNRHLYLYEFAKKYGPLFSMRIFRLSVVVISSARVAKEALKYNDLAFSNRPQTTSQKKLTYNGFDVSFSPYNERWREMRKIAIIQLLSNKQVNSFRPIREEEVSRFIKDLSRQTNEVIDLRKVVFAFASRMTCRTAFGKSLTGSQATRLVELLLESQAVGSGFFWADSFPSFAWIDKVSGKLSRLEKVYKDLDMFYQQLIDDHLDPNRPESMHGNIVDLLVRLREEQSASVHIDWDNIKAMIMNIFTAGTETSASVITWTMTALIKAPTAMKKARDELRSLLGHKGRVDEDDIQNLPYLKAVIKETMRLYPPIPLLLPRETMQSCNIDGYKIQPKTLVFVNVWAIGRDPEYWENPNEFIPERFLNCDIEFKGQDFGFIPFGSGRRGCPGLSLGVATVELVLANLLYSFDWNLADGVKEDDIDMDALPGATVHKKNPLFLVAKSYM